VPEYQIKPLEKSILLQVKSFSDQWIGNNYYQMPELEKIFEKSQKNKIMCSFVIVDEVEKIHGLRISYPPGNWSSGKGQGLRSDLWNVPQNKTAYFQSLFLSNDIQNQGWGPKLSQASIAALKKIGAKAIVTHAWKESPNNSSLKYLKRMGFVELIEHPDYWVNVDYVCTRDGNPCHCTAVEMILRLED
jgi:ribosomal protein S18 acetylase RimI-like enzyme